MSMSLRRTVIMLAGQEDGYIDLKQDKKDTGVCFWYM